MLKDRTNALIDGFVRVTGQIQARQLAGKAVALKVTTVLIAQGALAPWAWSPVDALSSSAVSTPIDIGLCQNLEQGEVLAALTFGGFSALDDRWA